MKKNRLILAKSFMILLALCSLSFGRDVYDSSTKGTKSKSFGKRPDVASDCVFVVDEDKDGDLDKITGHGTITFNLKVTRVVGNVADLVKSGAMEKTATLRMPAWDVDKAQGEVDEVYFNEKKIGTLEGADQTWSLCAFKVDVNDINFPSDPGHGGKVEPAINTITIKVDVKNEGWVTSIDWAQLNIQMAPPVVFVHGIRNDNRKWEKEGWEKRMDEWGILHYSADLSGFLELRSIETNSEELGEHISDLRRRWGVDAVTILAHSKGGIDSRDYAEEEHNDVDRLIQIATPNGGAKLANLGALFTYATYPVGGWAMGAARQLTPSFMKKYNESHGLNPKTSYSVIAGHVIQDGLIYETFGSEGDKVVSVTSAHTKVPPVYWSPMVSYDDSASHSEITKTFLNSYITRSREMITKHRNADSKDKSKVKPLTKRSVSSVSRSKMSNSPIEASTLNTYSTVLSANEKKMVPITVGINNGLNILSYYYDGNVDIAIVDPLGNRFDKHTHPNYFEVSDSASFMGYHIGFSYPLGAATGIWNIEISGSNFTGEQGVIFIVSEKETSVKLEVFCEQEYVPVGETLILCAKLNDNGTLLKDVSITADVNVDTSVNNVQFADDGVFPDTVANDGVYYASFKTVTHGEHHISVNALSNSPVVRRNAYLLTGASKSTTSLSMNSTDQGIDLDGNGLYDILRINLGLNVDANYTYRILAQLSTPDGMVIDETAFEVKLTIGHQTVALDFSGEAIYQAQCDGGYILNYVTMAETENESLIPLFKKENVYTSSSYTFSEFEHAPINLANTGSDLAIDNTGDGKFDLLRVSVGLNLDAGYQGSYEWSGSLYALDGTEIVFASGGGYLSSGQQMVTLDFEGEKIASSGEDGPYVLRNLILWNNSRVETFTNSVYQTQTSYTASQFSGGLNILDVTADVNTTYGSWSIDNSTGALMTTVTIRNDGAKGSAPLEKAFWYALQENADMKLAQVDGTTTSGLTYMDVTAQVEALLPSIGNGDMKMDVGESVSFTISIYTRDRSIPTGHIYAIWADPPIVPEAPATVHPADVDGNNIIDDFEILKHVDDWNHGRVDDFDLLNAVDLWRAGGYSWDKKSDSFIQ